MSNLFNGELSSSDTIRLLERLLFLVHGFIVNRDTSTYNILLSCKLLIIIAVRRSLPVSVMAADDVVKTEDLTE